MKKILFIILLVVLLCVLGLLLLGSCDEEVEITQVEHPDFETISTGAGGESWAIYWYLCGSDLESDSGFATGDLEEMLSVQLPENVSVVVQTGGAKAWDNDFVNPDYSERYLYNSEGMEFLGRTNKRNMGEASTLADFLDYCITEHPADNQALIFWNHGSGSVFGVAFDEQFDDDALTLPEINEAFSSVCEADAADPPFEIIGFDACLMATIDTAAALEGYGQYLVASEELEPGMGWSYDGMLNALAENPGMSGAQLGKAICDTYAAACNARFKANNITLSVVDLTKLELLLAAYSNLGDEALIYACDDTRFLSEFGRSARQAKNFGGNSSSQGYTNMVDLGDLVKNSSSILPETADTLLAALEQCVVYRINGPYAAGATGLSCFYSYDSHEREYEMYTELGASESFIHLFGYSIYGDLSREGKQYLENIDLDFDLDIDPVSLSPQSVPTLLTADLEDYPLYVDDNGNAVLDLGPEIADMLTGVYYHLAYVDLEDDFIMLLGRENDLYADWENGIFLDNFRGVWPALDGNFLYIEVAYEADDYTAYDVPILLNSEPAHLSIIYDYNEGNYYMEGVHYGLGDGGQASPMLALRHGDQITIMHYASTLDEDDDWLEVPLETVTFTGSNVIEEIDLGEAEFCFYYEMVDVQNNSMYSDMLWIETDEEYIYFSEIE